MVLTRNAFRALGVAAVFVLALPASGQIPKETPKESPKDPPKLSAEQEKAREAFLAGKLDDAIKALQAAAKNDPDDRSAKGHPGAVVRTGAAGSASPNPDRGGRGGGPHAPPGLSRQRGLRPQRGAHHRRDPGLHGGSSSCGQPALGCRAEEALSARCANGTRRGLRTARRLRLSEDDPGRPPRSRSEERAGCDISWRGRTSSSMRQDDAYEELKRAFKDDPTHRSARNGHGSILERQGR